LVIGIAVVTSLAGSGNLGFADGVGTQASFIYPQGVAVDSSGNIFVADWDNNRIRKISPTGGTFDLRLQQCMQCGSVSY
jgi:DNA-binding beta-propeller fold protein YncE